MLRIYRELKRAREIKHLTQTDLGLRMGQPQSAISRIENGSDVCLSTLLDMARALDVEIRLIPKQIVPAVDNMVESALAQHKVSVMPVTVTYDGERTLEPVYE